MEAAHGPVVVKQSKSGEPALLHLSYDLCGQLKVCTDCTAFRMFTHLIKK
jgi:hypothetical protein